MSKEVEEASREMARKALEARLHEIDMAPHEVAAYEKHRAAVRREIAQLRVILESVEAKSKVRVQLVA